MTDKTKILDRLQKLEDLIDENHKNDANADLFPKHWLVLLQVKNEVSTNGIVDRETLEKMNKIWRINKSIKKDGGTLPYEKRVWSEIAKLDDTSAAIRLFQDSFVKSDGDEYTLSEAKKKIDTHE